MAFVVFLSTMSFTIDTHYCGDFLVDVALFSKADPCQGEKEESGVESCGSSEKNCCSNENIVVDGQDELHLDIFDYSLLDQQLFVAAFTQSYLSIFKDLQKNLIPFNTYEPPNIEVDVQVFQQVFRI